jgi:hypothetical protein
MSHKSFLAPLPIRLASETTLKIQTLQSCTCFRATLRFKHLPRSHLTPIQPHPLFLQPLTISEWTPCPHSTCSPIATLSFVIGTFAALKKSITYTNGAQISVWTEWRVFIVPLLVDGGGGQGEGECVMKGVQLSAQAMAKWLVLERIIELAQLRLS